MSREMRKKVVFLPYDMDTANGTNNEGDLVFGYSLEDTDHLSGQIINLVDDGMCQDGEECTTAGEYISNANACRTGTLAVTGNTEYNVSDISENATRISVYLAGGGNRTTLTEDSHEYTFVSPAWAETAIVTFYGSHNPASFQVATSAVGADVFNGQGSVLWCNLRDMFPEELAEMYRQLRSNGKLSFDKVERMFEEHQAKWPEAIFNEDSQYKYIDPLRESADKTYLPMLQGSKAEQRKWWLYNRFRYMDSKFNAGDALTDYIQLRGYNKGNITITPYADIYPSVKFGSYLVQTRGQRNQTYTIECPLDRLNDTEIYIYSASALSSIGDISPLKVGLADFSRATKLQEIKVGDASASYSNTNMYALNFGNNTLLKKVDARNCVGLGLEHQGGTQRTVDMSLCTGLEEAYFDGTNIAALYLANGGELKKLHLPGTITNLTIRNQSNLTEFVCPDFSHITTLWLDNPAEVIDTLAIVQAMPTGGRARLFNFHWEMDDLSDVIQMFDKLDTMRGMDQNGNQISINQAVYGSIHVSTGSTTQINLIRNRYPDVTVTYDTLVPTIIYMNEDGTKALYYEAVPIGGSGTRMLPDAKEEDAQYKYTPMGWARTVGGDVDQSALTNVQTDRTVYAVYYRQLQSYPIAWKRGLEDGNDTLKTTNVSYGETPDYGVSTPVSTRGTVYAFQGWTPEIVPVTGPASYTAVFRAPVTLRYYDHDGTLLHEESVAYGRNGSWNSTPTRESTAQYSYAFSGWARTQGSAVDSTARQGLTADRDVYAVYNQTLRSYTISFVRASADGGGTLQTGSLPYGSMPSYTGATPTTTKTGDYAFIGWSPEITPVTGAQNYEAVFKDLSGPVVQYLKGTMTEYESNTATMVAESAFYHRLLTSVKTTASVIGRRAFEGIDTLTTVDLTNPTEVVSIKQMAFSSCQNITAIFIRSSQVATLENTNAFYSSLFVAGNAAVYVPANLVNSYKTATNWSTLADRIYSIDAYPVTNFDTIEDDWATIITKVNNGTANYALGDEKTLDLGTEGKVKMVIVGIDKDELADNSGNTAKYTWWAKVMPKTLEHMNPSLSNNTEGTGSVGGWEHSEMREYLAENGTIWNLLPAELQASGAIKAVKKYSRIYNTSGEVENDVVTTDKLFLFSSREVGSTQSSVIETMGPTYTDYFSGNSKRIGYPVGGSANIWWLRSAGNNAKCFANVNDDGSCGSGGKVYNGRGVGFGYCT